MFAYLTIPEVYVNGGVNSSPSSPRGFLMFIVAIILDSTSQTLLSAKERPGHTLDRMSSLYRTVSGQFLPSPKPKHHFPGVEHLSFAIEVHTQEPLRTKCLRLRIDFRVPHHSPERKEGQRDIIASLLSAYQMFGTMLHPFGT